MKVSKTHFVYTDISSLMNILKKFGGILVGFFFFLLAFFFFLNLNNTCKDL